MPWSWLSRRLHRPSRGPQRGRRPLRLEPLEPRTVPSIDFAAPVSYSLAPFSQYTTGDNGGIAVSDFNGDTHPDLVMSAWTRAISGHIFSAAFVLFGKSDGSFESPVQGYDTGGGFSGGVAVGDFNGDGKPDIVTPVGGFVRVLLSNGDGTFQDHRDTSSGG